MWTCPRIRNGYCAIAVSQGQSIVEQCCMYTLIGFLVEVLLIESTYTYIARVRELHGGLPHGTASVLHVQSAVDNMGYCMAIW